jgi:hypothetical protein
MAEDQLAPTADAVDLAAAGLVDDAGPETHGLRICHA